MTTKFLKAVAPSGGEKDVAGRNDQSGTTWKVVLLPENGFSCGLSSIFISEFKFHPRLMPSHLIAWGSAKLCALK